MYSLRYESHVVSDDIPSLGTLERRIIRKAIESKLTTAPEIYGIPLRQTLKPYRKFRVGDYRVIFRISGTEVLIFVIAHRSIVYKIAERRK